MKEASVCDHTSVGIIVWEVGKLLLIERKNFPFGFAPPAGHLDGDAYETAAKRELQEEVGLEVLSLKTLLRVRKKTNVNVKVGIGTNGKFLKSKPKGK